MRNNIIRCRKRRTAGIWTKSQQEPALSTRYRWYTDSRTRVLSTYKPRVCTRVVHVCGRVRVDDKSLYSDNARICKGHLPLSGSRTFQTSKIIPIHHLWYPVHCNTRTYIYIYIPNTILFQYVSVYGELHTVAYDYSIRICMYYYNNTICIHTHTQYNRRVRPKIPQPQMLFAECITTARSHTVPSRVLCFSCVMEIIIYYYNNTYTNNNNIPRTLCRIVYT